METQHDNIIRMQQDITYIKEAIDDIKKNFTPRSEFLPVKILVYGFIGIVMGGVVTSWVSNSLNHPNSSVAEVIGVVK